MKKRCRIDPKEAMTKIQVIFQKCEPGIIGRLIRWWTRGPYDHCALVFDGEILIEAQRQPGTHLAVLESIDTNRWDVIDLEVTKREQDIVTSFLMGELGCGYDWKGCLFAQVFGMSRESKTKWFCSELVVAALQRIGYFPGLTPCDMDPNDVARILRAECS